MARKVLVKSRAKRFKRKSPVEIISPEILRSVSLGTSEFSDLNKAIGRVIKMNMMYVTGNVKNQNIRLYFKINEISSGLAKTQVVMYEQIAYYLRRHIGVGSCLVEDSYVCKSSDGVDVVVKLFIITRDRVTKMISKALRSTFRTFISKYASSKSYEDFILSVILGRVQSSLKGELKKLVPLKLVELKKVGIKQRGGSV